MRLSARVRPTRHTRPRWSKRPRPDGDDDADRHHNTRQRQGGYRGVAGRVLRRRAARRYPGTGRALAARQAPVRQPQGQGAVGGAGHHEEALQAEGHRQRPSGQSALAAVPHRRRGSRAGRALARIQPEQESPPSRPDLRAVAEAG